MFMPPHIASIIAADHGRELRDRARADRVARPSRARRALRRRVSPTAVGPPVEASVTIRLARPSDEQALQRLAELDSRRVPGGEILVAALGDELAAALSLDGGEPVADPFLPASGLVALLGVRAQQLRAVNEPYSSSARAHGRPAVAGDERAS